MPFIVLLQSFFCFSPTKEITKIKPELKKEIRFQKKYPETITGLILIRQKILKSATALLPQFP